METYSNCRPRLFPVGTGFGTFTEIFKQHEPDALLRTSYFNHAHNDFLDLYLTGGVAALVILSAAIFGIAKIGIYVISFGRTRNKEILLAQMSFLIILMFAGASIADYPLRTPFLSTVFIIYVTWLSCLPSRADVFFQKNQNGAQN